VVDEVRPDRAEPADEPGELSGRDQRFGERNGPTGGPEGRHRPVQRDARECGVSVRVLDRREQASSEREWVPERFAGQLPRGPRREVDLPEFASDSQDDVRADLDRCGDVIVVCEARGRDLGIERASVGRPELDVPVVGSREEERACPGPAVAVGVAVRESGRQTRDVRDAPRPRGRSVGRPRLDAARVLGGIEEAGGQARRRCELRGRWTESRRRESADIEARQGERARGVGLDVEDEVVADSCRRSRRDADRPDVDHVVGARVEAEQAALDTRRGRTDQPQAAVRDAERTRHVRHRGREKQIDGRRRRHGDRRVARLAELPDEDGPPVESLCVVRPQRQRAQHREGAECGVDDPQPRRDGALGDQQLAGGEGREAVDPREG
jgi:hypothetical protein